VTAVEWTLGPGNKSVVVDTTSHLPMDRWRLENAREEDSGVYSCRAENSVGASRPHDIHVVVAPPPSFTNAPPPEVNVRKDERLVVDCEGVGDPAPELYWEKEGVGAVSTDRIISPQRRLLPRHPVAGRLLIENVTRESHGDYRCVLSNSIATVFRQMRLYVQAGVIAWRRNSPRTYPRSVPPL